MICIASFWLLVSASGFCASVAGVGADAPVGGVLDPMPMCFSLWLGPRACKPLLACVLKDLGGLAFAERFFDATDV